MTHRIVTSSWIASAAFLILARLASSQCTDDGHEENDSCAAAPLIELDANLHLVLRGPLHPGGADPDYFRMVVAPGQTLEVLVDAFAPPVFLLELFDEPTCAQPAASTEVIGTTLRLVNTDATPHEYWAGVRPRPTGRDFTCEQYTLIARSFFDVCAGLAPDAFEPNDDLPSAAPLPPGAYVDLTLHGPEWDFYLIPAPPGSLIELTMAQNLTEYPGATPAVVFVDAVTGQALQGGFPNGTTTYVNLTPHPNVGLTVVLTAPLLCSSYDMTVAVSDTPCTGLVPDVLEENDTCATALTLPSGEYQDLNMTYLDRDYYDVPLQPQEVMVAEISYDAEPASGVAAQVWRGCNLNEWFPVYSLPGRLTTVVRNEGATADGFTLSVRVDGQQFDPFAPCAEYDLALARYDQTIGARYCSAVPNSTGAPAVIDAYGSTVAADEELAFLVTDVPQYAAGIVFYGPTQVALPLGNGLRCVGGTLTRLRPVQSSGFLQYFFHVVDFDATPMAQHFLPGSTWHFQGWFRDGSSSNLSDAVTIPFL